MMPITMPRMQSFSTRDLLAESVAELVAQSLRDALESRDRASLLVSGGSTPKAMFQLLSGNELDWSKVDIGLVDERFVPDTHGASNAKLVKETLLQGAAASARFVPLVASDDLVEAVSIVERILSRLCCQRPAWSWGLGLTAIRPVGIRELQT